jgi:hypothetical protein
MTKYFVEIVQKATDDEPEKVIKRLGPRPERNADKIERGINRNLNHDLFYTRQTEASGNDEEVQPI